MRPYRHLIPRVSCLAALLLPACRDSVAHVTLPPPLPAAEGARQVTFGDGQDRDPRWTPAGDMLLYHTDRFGMMPQARGVVLSLDPTVVRAEPIFGDLQQWAVNVGSPFMLATPAPSPDGARIAYMDMQVVDTPAELCFDPGPVPPPASAASCQRQPLLGMAVLRVRDIDATGQHTHDPSIQLAFPGTDPKYRLTDLGPYHETLFPFQELHRTEHAMLFRPSWSPDGQRIVTTNGVHLLSWRVGSTAFDTIPGTHDAVSPAWSPDGEWIAFTELVRGDSAVVVCRCVAVVGGKLEPQEHRRTVYDVAARRVVLVRPDGSDRVMLGEGEDPAWSPDGQYIYAIRNGAIVRIPRSGGAAVTVPHTGSARSPSVSPDGRWLAFSRPKPFGPQDYDIWIVSLVP